MIQAFTTVFSNHDRRLATRYCRFRRRSPPIWFGPSWFTVCMKLQMCSGRSRWRATPADGNQRTLRLLQEPFSNRAVGHDAPLDQALAVPVAAGAEPLFIEPEEVVIRGQRVTLADVGQHV